MLKYFKKWRISVRAVGSCLLNDVLFIGGYFVVLSYLMMCYGDRV